MVLGILTLHGNLCILKLSSCFSSYHPLLSLHVVKRGLQVNTNLVLPCFPLYLRFLTHPMLLSAWQQNLRTRLLNMSVFHIWICNLHLQGNSTTGELFSSVTPLTKRMFFCDPQFKPLYCRMFGEDDTTEITIKFSCSDFIQTLHDSLGFKERMHMHHIIDLSRVYALSLLATPFIKIPN